MNAIVPAEQTERTERQSYQVIDPIPVLDTARFEHMQRIAKVMAASSLIPDALCMTGTKNNKQRLSDQVIFANCFLVVNQAVRWDMDPFAVAQCVSVVHGKLCYEGKLIAAVLEAKVGVRLIPEYDAGKGKDLKVTIYAYDENNAPITNPRTKDPLTVSGTVSEWETSGDGSPWGAQKNWRRQLLYRGTREWARWFRPEILLGVYSDDELDELSSISRSSRARDVTPSREPPPPSHVEPPPPTTTPDHPAPMIENNPSIPLDPIPPAPEEVHIPFNNAGLRATHEYVTEQSMKEPAFDDRKTPEARDPDRVVETFEEAADAALDSSDLFEAWQSIVEPVKDDLFPPDLKRCEEKYHRALSRFQK